MGRLIPKKGFDVLIKACAIIKGKGINFVCGIVGEGSEYRNLTRLVKENDLVDKVKLLGKLSYDDVVIQYQQASILVAPSRVCKNDVDGLPTVIIEALALGVPVIATPIAGITDLIKGGETGLIVPPDDEKALSNVICEILDNHNMQASLAICGRNRVLEEFDISKTIKNLHVVMLDNRN